MFLINSMIRKPLIFNLFLTIFTFEVYADEVINIPDHDSNFVRSSAAQGFYFTAPVDFTITGIDVPNDAGDSPFDASIYRLKNVTTYPPYMPLSDIETLADFSDQSTAVNGLNIAVSQGEIIGAVGRRGIITSYTTSANNTFDSYIDEHLVTFTRLDIDNYQTTTPNISTDSMLPSGRIFLTYSMAEPEAAKKKASEDEAAKIKAVEEEDAAQKKQSSDPTIVTGRLNYTFVPLNNAKIKISNDNILTNEKFNTPQQNKKDQNELLSLKVLEINTVKLQPHNFEFGEMPIFDAYTANLMTDTQTDSQYFPENIDYEKQAADYAKLVKHNLALQANTLTNEHVQKTLKNETLAGDPLYGKRMVIEFLIKTDPNRMKVITNNGIIRTIYSSNAAKLNTKDGISKYQGLTMGSVLLNTNLTGRDQGTPLCIYDLVNAVTNIAYSGKSHFKNQDMRDLASRTYKYLINIIDDKNKDKAMEMPAYLLKQIQLQAGSIDNSGGSAGGNDHHHDEGHHEEAM